MVGLPRAKIFGELFEPLVHIALAIIVFEGGLSLRRHELEHVGAGVKRLISGGVIFTWLLGALAAHYVGGLSWPVANLFGAIIVVTDSSIMMTLLRQARLQPRTAAMLKWEAILNDPLGTLLAVLVFEYYIFSHGSLPLNQVLINFAWGLGASIALDLSEIGVLLAATDNDAYNALVCLHFSAEFGRDWVYQLPHARSAKRRVKSGESNQPRPHHFERTRFVLRTATSVT